MALNNYSIRFKDIGGEDCQVEIIGNPNTAGFAIPLTGDVTPLILSYNLEDQDDVFSAVGTSKATISVICDGSDQALQFIEEMAVMTEGQYQVKITGSKFWQGALIPDEQTRTFSMVSGTMKVTAVDRLTQMKGKILLDDDDKYVTGLHSFKEYIDYCFAKVQPAGSTDTVRVFSDLTLDAGVSLPSIIEQIGVYAETFNDDMGRPINCFDVISQIAQALSCRVFYSGAGFLYFVDMLQYGDVTWGEAVNLGLKADTNANITSRLINNSENITTTRTFLESDARFDYHGVIGLLKNGLLVEWLAYGGGYKAVDWYYNDALEAQSDVYERRQGTGRQGNAYGILIRCNYDYSVQENEPITDFGEECIASTSDTPINSSDNINVSIEYSFPDGNAAYMKKWKDNNPITAHKDDFNNFMTIGAIVYNFLEPTKSLRLTQNGIVIDGTSTVNTPSYQWEIVDLDSTSFSTGVCDMDFFDIPELPEEPTQFQKRKIPKVSIPIGDGHQTIEIDLPKIPGGVQGQLYFAVRPNVMVTNKIPSNWWRDHVYAPNRTTETIFYSILVSKSIPKVKQKQLKGDIVYVSRYGNVSSDKYEKDLTMNTTINNGVAGAIFTTVSYISSGGDTIDEATLVTSLQTKRPEITGDFSLLEYNAKTRMIYNFNQYKIDMEAKFGTIDFFNQLFFGFSLLYDPARPSTNIYRQIFLQTRHECDVKEKEYRITCISMKQNAREFSLDTLDSTHDLVEISNIS